MKKVNEELRLWLKKIDRKQNDYDELKDEFFNLKQSVRGHDILHHENQAKFTTVLTTIKEKLISLEENIRETDNNVTALRTDMDTNNQTIIDHKTFYNNEMKNHKNFIIDLHTEAEGKVKKLQLKTDYIDGIMKNHKKDIDQLITDYEVNRLQKIEDDKNLANLLHFQTAFTNSLGEGNEVIEKFIKVSTEVANSDPYHEINMLGNRINEVEKSLRKTDNYIEKQIPLQYTTDFGQLLDYTITSRAIRERLMEFMDYKITEYNELIDKDRGWPNNGKELEKAKVTSFKYSQLTIPELVKQLRLKSQKSK